MYTQITIFIIEVWAFLYRPSPSSLSTMNFTGFFAWLPQTAVLCSALLSLSAAQSGPTRLFRPWYSPGKNTGMGCHALLQGIFPTQVSSPRLPHCRWILYPLSHQGSPTILEWVVYPSSRGSSWLGNRTGISCMAGRFFTSWATREAPSNSCSSLIQEKDLHCIKIPM